MNIASFSSSLFGPKIMSLFCPSSVDKPSFEHCNCSNTSCTGMCSYIRGTSLQSFQEIYLNNNSTTQHSKNSISETNFLLFVCCVCWPKQEFRTAHYSNQRQISSLWYKYLTQYLHTASASSSLIDHNHDAIKENKKDKQ